MKLADRTAIVTGANRGFGAHIALHFAREGARVLICGRNEQRLSETLNAIGAEVGPDRVWGRRVDVASEGDVEALFDEADRLFGRLDALVNCAGICGPAEPFAETDWAHWKRAIDIDILGTAYPTLLALWRMRPARGGKIVNISGGGATKPLKNLSAYSTAKAGIVRFTETIAREVEPEGIDVNAVAPGILYTGLVEEFMKAGVESLGEGYFKEIERLKREGPASMDQAAQLCVWLASTESDGITGRLISAKWDPWATLAERRDVLAGTDIYTLRRIGPEERGQFWGED